MVPTRYHVSEDQDEEEGESGLAENDPYTRSFHLRFRQNLHKQLVRVGNYEQL